MASLTDTMKRPSRMVQRATRNLPRRSRWSSVGIAGSVAGALALVAVAWFLPEVMRYIKIERM